jgi:hypothetical protein
MANTVGEFFVNIGIKGGGEAFKALASIKNALSDMSAGGIAAKAAVLGAVYALEQWTSQSAAYGNNLSNFATLTGVATTKTQQLAEAIREATAQDGTATAQSFITGFQSKVAAWHMKGTPMAEAMHRFASATGYDINNQDPFVLIAAGQKLMQNPNSGYSKGDLNEMMRQMGFDPLLIVTAEKFKDDILKIKKNIESPGTVAGNDKVMHQWSDFWKRLEVIRDVLTAKWGLPVITELNYGLTILQGWEKSLENIRNNPLWKENLLNFDADTSKNGWSALAPKAKEEQTKALPSGLDVLKSGWNKLKKVNDFLSIPSKYHNDSFLEKGLKHLPGNHGSINVHQTNYGVKDAKESIEHLSREIGLAYYSNSSRGQIT